MPYPIPFPPFNLYGFNTSWRSDIAWCISFLHYRREEKEPVKINIRVPFSCPLPWCHLLLQPKFFSEIITNISPFALTFIAWKQNLSIVGWQCYLFPGTLQLATSSIHCIMHSCLITTIHETVRNMCEAIWEFLWDAFVSQKSEKERLHTADEFYERPNIPNYLGAVDGKHKVVQAWWQQSPIFQPQEFLFYDPYGISRWRLLLHDHWCRSVWCIQWLQYF